MVQLVAVESHYAEVNTCGFADIVDISDRVQHAISEGTIESGLVCVFVSGSTGALTTLDYESGSSVTERYLSISRARGGTTSTIFAEESNRFSRVRAALVGPSLLRQGVRCR